MIGAIHGRAGKIVHRGIDHRDRPDAAVLHVENPRHQDAGIADHRPARLEHQLASQAADRLAHHRGIVLEARRRLVPVGDADAAAEIEACHVMPGRAQGADLFGQAAERRPVGREAQQLRTDMHGEAGRRQVRQFGGPGVGRQRPVDRDAELVLLAAGRDLVVGPGIDIGIDAQGDPRRDPGPGGDGGDQVEFRFRFDIELVDAGAQRQGDFLLRLADAGKHDPAGRNARGKRPAQFAARHDIGAGAQPGERRNDRLVGVGLQGVADRGGQPGERASSAR